MKYFVFLLVLLCSTPLFAGEDVTVSWTPPDDIATLPYSGYKLFWTDSTGTDSVMVIPNPATQQVVIPNVEFGSSAWRMRSLCSLCEQVESADSNTVEFTVKYKGVPSAPVISVSLGSP